MKVTSLSIPEVKILDPKIFKDERGLFYETFNQKNFNEFVDEDAIFVQDNISQSISGVLRGLHYQKSPFPQGKLVSVLQGEVFDVAVDIRRSSSTFGRYVSATLSAENKKQIWIPEGFAHGFLTLSDTALVYYKATNFYSPIDERCIAWNDSVLNINWPNKDRLFFSAKDSLGKLFKEADLFS
ncbi:dTDP-4-dehydrorhamnose 3,5-epimerase [Methylophilales bacterium HTCC2181]|uniref:dTDP-4-dehydrorhamnose 3,5-epimerase n=1 Tax=Methylophilales bacterium HTCC2181 TaxID=383631 RepID=A0P799_9PROT|nr:dTDP-4-dehydrorhamnose 3,5-epimerase [Methylophilales bacterium HTCC2181]